MSAQVWDEFKETVRAQTDIVGLIGEAVRLESRSGGREFVGLCPFHDDHNPSMRVYPDRQSFRCWVCDQGGDCFSFVMERERVGFREALEILAQRSNIPVPKRRGGRGPSGDEPATGKAKLFEVLAWAEQEFHSALKHDPSAQAARNYLAQRGITAETIDRYRIGYHPNNWKWLLNRANTRFSPQQLAAAGLAGESKQDRGYFDYFVDRVLFTIHNERGQAVAFGGRIFPGSSAAEPKYWNGPDSPVFSKSRLIYGLDRARDAIRKQRVAVVFEGDTDCIIARQYGLETGVATLGTALTDQHVTVLRRFADRVVLVFDGDDAGQKAAARSVDRFLAQDVDLRVLTLPDGIDPADYLPEHGLDGFQRLIDAAPEAWNFKFRAVAAQHDIHSVDGRRAVLDEMLTALARIPGMAGSVKEDMLLGELGERLGVTPAAVHRRYQQLRQDVRVHRPHAATETEQPAESEQRQQLRATIRRLQRGQANATERAECELLQSLFAAPRWTGYTARYVSAQDIRCEPVRELLRICYESASAGGPGGFDAVRRAVEDPVLLQLAVWMDEQCHQKRLATDSSDTATNETAESADKSFEEPHPAGGQSAGNLEEDGDCPPFLRRSIDAIQWRRAEQSHQNVAVELSQHRGRLDDAAADLLRRASEFHRQRATRKTGS